MPRTMNPAAITPRRRIGNGRNPAMYVRSASSANPMPMHTYHQPNN